MPIKVPNNLPAIKILEKEKIFVITENRATTQDIRPLKILLVNLMPKKIETETQFSRLLSNTALQIELELMMPKNHKSKNVSEEHLQNFYKTFDDVKNERFDGCIITGAPVEHLDFNEVDYYDELCEIMEWTKSNVFSTLHICWGAQAGLNYHYGIGKIPLEKKLFGIYKHTVEEQNDRLFRGFDDEFYIPHSRHTTIDRKEVEKNKNLHILASSSIAGIHSISANHKRQIFVLGHAEYDKFTLKEEYDRDVAKNLPIEVPKNYFVDDDTNKDVIVRWRASAHLFFSNWLNYVLYQETPYDLNKLESIK